MQRMDKNPAVSESIKPLKSGISKLLMFAGFYEGGVYLSRMAGRPGRKSYLALERTSQLR